jgi:uncharacterized protein YegP (UPF0339 family)
MKFQIYADAGGKYRWRLVASNGRTAASSVEHFDSKANAWRAAEDIKANARNAEIVDV